MVMCQFWTSSIPPYAPSSYDRELKLAPADLFFDRGWIMPPDIIDGPKMDRPFYLEICDDELGFLNCYNIVTCNNRHIVTMSKLINYDKNL
jgi:hypothetical protein